MTLILSFFITALVFAAMPDVEDAAQMVDVPIQRSATEGGQKVSQPAPACPLTLEDEEAEKTQQVVTVHIKRFGSEDLQQVAWNVYGLMVDGRRVWDTLLAHPCHGPDAFACPRTLEDKEFVPDAGLDGVLKAFTKALKNDGRGISDLSCERLDGDFPSGRIGRSDARCFEHEKWCWWSGMTWDLLSYFKNRPLASGHVWLTLNSQMITIEGSKVFGTSKKGRTYSAL